MVGPSLLLGSCSCLPSTIFLQPRRAHPHALTPSAGFLRRKKRQSARGYVPYGEAFGREKWSACKTQASMDVSISREVDVAIVGGGPGGLAAANAIRQTRPDLSIGVFERSEGLHRIGWAIGVAHNGMHAIQAISQELCDQVAKHGNNKGVTIFDLEDKLVMKLPIFYAPIEGHEDVKPGLIPWYILQRTFAAALPSDCLQLGHSFESLEQDEEGVTLHFTKSSTPGESVGVRAKVAIGADGNQSGVRESILKDGPPTFLNTVVWRGQCAMPSDWPLKEIMATGWKDAEEANFFYVIQLPGDILAWQLMGSWPSERLKELSSSRYVDTSAMNASGQAKLDRCLSKLTGRFPEWPLKLVHGTELSRVTEHGQFYREASDCQKWTLGRATLLGDAAHLFTPFLGQGVNQTMEDALVIARSIGRFGATTEALLDYEATRAPYATKIQAVSVQIAKDIFLNKLPNTELEWLRANSDVATRRHAPLERAVVGQRLSA